MLAKPNKLIRALEFMYKDFIDLFRFCANSNIIPEVDLNY